MNKIATVESAKALMTDAMAWSVMKWLREKKRVRQTADAANAALDQLEATVKAGWDEGLKTAYGDLGAGGNPAAGRQKKQSPKAVASETVIAAKKVKDADEEAQRARADAEETFDEAERQLSTSLAREGCGKAIRSWELHEKAIRKAEEACHWK